MIGSIFSCLDMGVHLEVSLHYDVAFQTEVYIGLLETEISEYPVD